MIVIMNVGINIGTLIHFQIKEEMFEFLCTSGMTQKYLLPTAQGAVALLIIMLA